MPRSHRLTIPLGNRRSLEPEKLQLLFFLDRAILGFAQRLRLVRAETLVKVEQARLMRPHLAQRALLPFVERLVAIAHAILAALGLQEHGDFRQHVRELVPLEFHIALALLLEADSDPMADELMRQRARDVGDPEPENDLFERRSVAGLQPLGDELANLLVANFLGFDLVPDFDRRVGGVAGAKRRVEFFERLLGVVDQLDLHLRLIFHAILTPPANGRALDAASASNLIPSRGATASG